jgi:CO/xanthine dehydrogenase FAD-binding subunit
MYGFQFRSASSYADAWAMYQSVPGAMYVAGGTDLLPNTKHGLFAPKLLIGLGAISGYVRHEASAVRIGAATTLQELADH